MKCKRPKIPKNLKKLNRLATKYSKKAAKYHRKVEKYLILSFYYRGFGAVVKGEETESEAEDETTSE